MMNLGHLPHLCCWSTCMDNSLRCALALRKRSNIEFHSCLCLCLCFHWTHQSGLLPLEPVFVPPLLSSIRLFCHSPIHQLLFHVPAPFGPFLPVPLPALYPFQAIAHTLSCDTSLLASWSVCVVLASCVPTFPRSIGTGPSSAIISLMMISYCFNNFVEPSSVSPRSLD